MTEITVRPARKGDGGAVARMALENSSYYVRLAPDDFRIPDEDGLADFIDSGAESVAEDEIALVAEVDGEVAGYLEARLLLPMETARWQGQPDLGKVRLYINVVETAPAFQRRGAATSLVQAAEEWGRSRGASVAVCDTWVESPVSIPFWERRMGYRRRAVTFRKPLV